MCHLITLVVANADAARVDAFMRARGRRAEPGANPAIAKALRPGEAQYSTSVIQCDCGTALAPRAVAAPDYAQQAEKLRKQGWSEAKIERALAQKSKSAHKPKSPDSVDYWVGVLRDLPAATGASAAGLLLHWYSGGFDAETFAITRAEISASDLEARLGAFQEDVVLITRA